MRTRRKKKVDDLSRGIHSPIHFDVDDYLARNLATVSLPILFFSVPSVSSVPKWVLRRATHVGYPCWVESGVED